VSHIYIVLATGSFGSSWLISCSSTMSGLELRWAVGCWMGSGAGLALSAIMGAVTVVALTGSACQFLWMTTMSSIY